MERLPAEHSAAPTSSPQGGAPVGRPRGDQESAPGAGARSGATAVLDRPPAQRADGDGPPARARSGPAFSPRHWRVRSKLAAVLLVPAIAFLVLASINMATQIASARDFGRGATVAEFGRQASTLVHELQAERDLASGYVAADRPKSNQPKIDKAIADNKVIAAENVKIAAANEKLPEAQQKPLRDEILVEAPNELLVLQAQQTNVDGALAAYRSAEASLGDVGEEAQGRVDAAGQELAGLSRLRASLTRQQLTEGAISGTYTEMINSLRTINREIGQGTGDAGLTSDVVGLTALSDLKETLSQERSLLYAVASGPEGSDFQYAQQQRFAAVVAERGAALERFRSDATDQQRGQYDTLVNGQAVLAVKRLEDSVSRQQSGEVQLDAQQWFSAATTYLQAMRVVETGLLDQVVGTTRDLRSDAQRQAITTGVVIAAILVIAFLTSLLIARSMIVPLRRLQSEASDVANVRLPEAIARLQRPDATSAPPEIQPIGIDSRDEIGEVAKTFDVLHKRAVELASEQAGLRRNVNDMFVNLSRRSQGLVERQLKLIDELETGEQDPDQLANLFKLDHLATRMRRNSENLLVLAGEDAGRRWGRPIPLVDVLRAATSEVEQYHRIQLTGVPDVEVMGHAVNHLVHLVAELLENATVFSSPESKVLVHSQRLSDGGAMVEIEDRGIGMSAHEISDSNERLAKPPEFDVSVSRMMGLYVVGRLATRHGITVRLRQAETGGISAFVRIPVDVLAGKFEAPRPEQTPAGPPARAGSQQDGRPPARTGLGMLPTGATAALGSGPRPIGPGPAADLPRRPLSRPGGPPEPPPAPGSAPLPRRTPATASGSDGASAGGVDDLPVNGAPVNGIPGGRPALPGTPAGAPASTGSAFTGPNGNGNGYAGNGAAPTQDRPGFDRPAQDRPGFDRSAQDRPAQDRPGPDRPVFERPGGPDRPGADRSGPGAERPGPERPGSDRAGPDRRLQDRAAPDLPTRERPAQDRPGPDRSAQDRPLPGRPGPGGAAGPGPDGRRAPLPPRPVPSLGTGGFGGQPSSFGSPAPFAAPPAPFGAPAAGAPAGLPESTPIFEQLQSEWFRQRPATPRPAAAPDAAPAPADGARPAPAAERAPAQAVPQPAAAAAAAPAAPAAPPADDAAWASPADEGWRAAERLLQPSSGGTTRAGLPMRVPQAHLMPGGAGSGDGPSAVAPEPPRPAYRSPEAVRSRLSSYHQGVRRGRHADRAPDDATSATGATNGDNGERDPSEVLVQQSQEQS